MKKIIIGVFAFLFFIIMILIGMTVQGRTSRQTELENAMTSSMEKTMQMLVATNDVKPISDDEMIAYFMEAISVQIESASTLTVNILEADVNKGILSAEGILTYLHPIGTEGNVRCHKTAILEDYVNAMEANGYSVQFLVEGEIYKKYTLSKGSQFINPGIPKVEGKTFAGWNYNGTIGSFENLLGSNTINENIILTAVFE